MSSVDPASKMSSHEPRVSILMGTWNRARLLPAAVRSIQNQSFKDWELIIADDGSTDETPQVVQGLKMEDERIRYVRNPRNQGISKNYNTGLRLAKGEYVAMIDDDDPWIGENKLARQVKFLDEHPNYVGCGGGVIVVDPAGKPFDTAHGKPFDTAHGKELYRYFKPQTDAEIRKLMLFGNPMANSTTLFRRAAGEEVGWYDETTRYSGDRDFWLKMGLIGRLYNFPEYFSYYTMSGENTSIAKMKPHLQASLKIMQRYKGKYPHYFQALLLNQAQYLYSFLPVSIRRPLHVLLARLKRAAVG